MGGTGEGWWAASIEGATAMPAAPGACGWVVASRVRSCLAIRADSGLAARPPSSASMAANPPSPIARTPISSSPTALDGNLRRARSCPAPAAGPGATGRIRGSRRSAASRSGKPFPDERSCCGVVTPEIVILHRTREWPDGWWPHHNLRCSAHRAARPCAVGVAACPRQHRSARRRGQLLSRPPANIDDRAPAHLSGDDGVGEAG